jgi:hypothetical protein
MTTNDGCSKLEDLLKAETNVIKKHIDKHKYFQHIPNYDDGVIDFISKYGFIMKELYCGYACINRSNCNLAKEYVPKDKESDKQLYLL